MKKLIIAIGLYFSIYSGLEAQNLQELKASANQNYSKPKLKLEEINFVSSYYNQDGNHSAVTGGNGTEALYNFGNSLDITISLTDKHKRVHNLNADFNVDAYTSASSDNIDPVTISGASRRDVHIYPSLTYSVKNPETGFTKKIGVSYSTEWDYISNGINVGLSKISKDKNTEISFKAAAFIDKWLVILPYELRPTYDGNPYQYNDVYKARNTYVGGITVSHIVNKNFDMLLMVEPSYQEGLLSTPYHRAYFTNGNHTVEKLPGTRVKLPIGLRASYFAGDKVVLRGFYRYYMDSWGMTGHTASLEVPVKINPFASISPFYRFSTQTAVKYFKPYGEHLATDTYYTSDYDISGFNSHLIGLNFRRSTPGGVFGIPHFNAFEVRLAYYNRGVTGMNAGIATVLFKIK